MDPISDVFTALEVQSVTYGRFEFGAPWGIRFPPVMLIWHGVTRSLLAASGRKWRTSLDAATVMSPRAESLYSLRDEATSALVDLDAFISTLQTLSPLRRRRTNDGDAHRCLHARFVTQVSRSWITPCDHSHESGEPQSSTLQNTIFDCLQTKMQHDAPGSQSS